MTDTDLIARSALVVSIASLLLVAEASVRLHRVIRRMERYLGLTREQRRQARRWRQWRVRS